MSFSFVHVHTVFTGIDTLLGNHETEKQRNTMIVSVALNNVSTGHFYLALAHLAATVEWAVRRTRSA